MSHSQADHGSVAAHTISDSEITIINNDSKAPMSKEEARQYEQQYLQRLFQDCAGLEWLKLMQKQDQKRVAVSLDKVYTALLVQGGDEGKRPDPALAEGFEKRQQTLSVVKAADQHQRLVLTGDPGSGKSAFVSYLALCLAGEALGHKQAHIHALTEPLPDDEGKLETERIEVEGSDEKQEREVRQPWGQGFLVPVRVILRDFSASEYFPAYDRQADAFALLNFLEAVLQEQGLDAYWPVLRARLCSGRALLLLDGLDEVPEAGEKRVRLVQCIEGFVKTHAKCRFLVTCRPYAYQNPQWQLSDFQERRLAPFKRGQIIRFIRRWYEHSPDYQPEAAQQRIQTLQRAVLSRPALHELAQRPLLLSLIAYLHANRHDLPERRADLYERLLELLVDEWEKARFAVADASGAVQLEQHSLAEFLQVGQDTIRKVLERLAFRAHALQDQQNSGTADIAAKDLIFELSREARLQQQNVNEWELCVYLRDRVGILYQRGGTNEMEAVYTFPHRSFQEYLAAAYFRRDEDALFDQFADIDLELDATWQELAAQLARSDPDRWREVIVLAGGIRSVKDVSQAWMLLDALFSEEDSVQLDQQIAWGLRLAAEILAESVSLGQLKRHYRRILGRIQARLPEVVTGSYLPALERVATGRYLAQLGNQEAPGDPRPEVNSVDSMPFCYVPAGAFYMGRGQYDKEGDVWLGEETPAGEYDLNYGYWLAQHPVTQAQFQQFVTESDFQVGNDTALKTDSNAPVVSVSQREALAFCQWLTTRWQEQGRISPEWRVSLPNEPEWEKAARGGLEIPERPCISSVSAGGFDSSPVPVMTANPEPQRRYTWGDKIDSEHCNYDMNVQGSSALGAYGKGVSPVGCHDLAGNVWEWTRSHYADYPYPAVGSAEWRQQESEAGDKVGVVLRGGAFNYYRNYVRCAVRNDLRPGYRNDYIGFRVVLSPLL